MACAAGAACSPYAVATARDFFGAKLIARNFCHGARTMPTFSLEADEQHDSFQNENDRTVGIVGGSILEARLEEKLKLQLRAAGN
jgi:hypothetical protein